MRVLTTKEAAEQLQCSTKTVISWIKAGKLPGVRGPGGWRINQEDLSKFLRGGYAVPVDAVPV
jgi:excisionase family DNA binding protein